MIISHLPAYRLTRLPVWTLLILVLLRPIDLSATTNDLSRVLQQGLFEEEANHNLEAAAQAYQSVVSTFDRDRKLAATALFRLGEVHRKQGRTNEANAYYERVLREFADQKVLADAAQQHVTTATATTSSSPRSFDERLAAIVARTEQGPAVIDNRLASFAGLWREAGAARDRYGDDYRFASTITSNQVSQGLAQATFRPGVPATGKYHVEIWYPGGENRSTNSRWTIYAGEEQDLPTISVNQRTNAGKWFRIASDVHFVKGKATITLSNVTGETNAVVVADAVRVVPADDSLSREIAANASTSQSTASSYQQRLTRLMQHANANTVVVDDTDAVFNGNWNMVAGNASSALSPDRYGPSSRFASSVLTKEPTSTATFRPSISTPGLFYVELWFSGGANRSRTTPWQATTQDGVVRGQVDQTLGGRWIRIGDSAFRFTAGTNNFVQIANNTGRTGEVVIADAVRFLPVVAPLVDPSFTAEQATPAEELEEIARIKRLMQNSPDLISNPPANAAPLLHQATAKGQLEVARFLLDNGAEVNVKSDSSNGGTALHTAAMSGNKAMAELLLSRGADVNAADKEGWTALHYAANRGFKALTETLLLMKANPNAKTKSNTTPLHVAINYTNVMALLMKHGADLNGARTEGDFTPTPLHDAARSRRPEAAKFLVDYKADVNASAKDHKNQSGVTPLHEAVKNLDLQMAGLLLAAGANPNSRFNFYFDRPSGNLIRNTTMENVSPLDVAVLVDSPELAKLLLKHKADPNAGDKNGIVPLHRASSTAVATVLLDHGANVDAKTHEGVTPLLGYQRPAELVRLYLEQGANPNAQNIQGDTALHLAVWARNKENAELLLQAKTDPNIENQGGKTPLDLVNASAAQLQNNASDAQVQAWKEIAQLLIQHGADEYRTRRKQISLTRNFTVQFTPFHKTTNTVNRFTLLELIAEVYGRNDWMNDVQQQLAFPDFRNVTISRLDDGRTNTIAVNVEKMLETGDCSNDPWLEWGDLVFIPEADHRLNEQWAWQSHQRLNLIHCLKRRVEVIVKGDRKRFLLVPSILGQIHTTGKEPAHKEEASGERIFQTFWAKQLIPWSDMLLASSDLTRVTIRRNNPFTNKPEEFGVNLSSSPAENIWLRDGDSIEIPERDPNAAPVNPQDAFGQSIRTIPTRVLRVPPGPTEQLPPPTPSTP